MVSTNQNLFQDKRSFLIFMALGVVLSLSLVMSVLAPLPLALALLFYGKMRVIPFMLGSLALLWTMAYFITQDFVSLGVYGVMALMAFVVLHISQWETRPGRSYIRAGIGIFTFILLGLILLVNLQELPVLSFIEQKLIAPNVEGLREFVDKVAGDSSQKMEAVAILNNTEFLAKQLLVNIPFALFSFIMMTLWVNGYLFFKANRIFNTGKVGAFSEFDFLSYRVSDYGVIFVLASLVLILWGEGQWALHAQTVLKCLGVLYFFQGLGVLIQLLNFWGIRGFLRLFLLFTMVGLASWFVAGVGFLDTWFDFRKRVILGSHKKNNK